MHQVLPEKEYSSSTVPRDQLTNRERDREQRERERYWKHLCSETIISTFNLLIELSFYFIVNTDYRSKVLGW